MGSISNSTSLRVNLSLRSPYKIYLFEPSSMQTNLLIYSAQKIYKRFLRNKELARKYNKNLDVFNLSFTNSGTFCFSIRVFDKPTFFPGFFRSLLFKPKILPYFFFNTFVRNLHFFSRGKE